MGLYQYRFRWVIHNDGYRCADQVWFGRRLVARSERCRSYYPLQECDGLFMDFAAMQATEVAIEAFASKYGLLGTRMAAFNAIDQDNQSAERVRFWIQEIEEMKLCVELWDTIQAEDEKRIAKHLTRFPSDQKPDFIQQDRVYYHGQSHANRYVPDEAGIVSAALACPGIPDPSNLIQEALNVLQCSINLHISGLWQTGLAWDESERHMGIFIVPTSLLGAMWLQFAEAVSGRKGYGSCPSCGRYFEVHTENARSDKTYCSEACKSKKYRDRKISALSMHANGVALEEIARLVSSRPEIVAGWIAHPSRKRKQIIHNAAE